MNALKALNDLKKQIDEQKIKVSCFNEIYEVIRSELEGAPVKPQIEAGEDELIEMVSTKLAAQEVGYDDDDFEANVKSWYSVSKEIVQALRSGQVKPQMPSEVREAVEWAKQQRTTIEGEEDAGTRLLLAEAYTYFETLITEVEKAYGGGG